jgi:Leucine Rich repeat
VVYYFSPFDRSSIHYIIRQALAAIDVNEQNQGLVLHCEDFNIDGANARHLANFMRHHAHAVDQLSFEFLNMSCDAVEILGAFLVETIILTLRLDGFLATKDAGRLLSSLHRNESITELELRYFGLEGQTGGKHLSDLMQNNSTLTTLVCLFHHLGVDGARALQPGLRENRTVDTLVLSHCWLGDEGLGLVAHALEGNSSLAHLILDRNGITANGLPHLTRLLHHHHQQQEQRDGSSLEVIDLDGNPEILDNLKNTRLFSTALSQCTTISEVRMSYCEAPVSSTISLLQATVINKEIDCLCINDHAQIEPGQDLQTLLDIIPVVHLSTLYINLDFTPEDVISSFHRNLTIQNLHSGDYGEEITTGPVVGSLERNRLLHVTVRLAVAAINVDEEEQELNVVDDDFVVDAVNARLIADSLRLHPRAINKLCLFCCDELTTEAVEVFRAYFAESTLREIFLVGPLDNYKGTRLLSGMHGNTSLTTLELTMNGLHRTGAGTMIAELLMFQI